MYSYKTSPNQCNNGHGFQLGNPATISERVKAPSDFHFFFLDIHVLRQDYPADRTRLAHRRKNAVLSSKNMVYEQLIYNIGRVFSNDLT